MRNFRYLAMTQAGEIVNGSIFAPTAAEVAHRIEYLGLVPIETVAEEGTAAAARVSIGFFNRPRAEDVTIFTRDLALLLKAGARLDNGLELLADDSDIGRLRPIINKMRAGVMAGESFAEAIAQHPPISLRFMSPGAGWRDLGQTHLHPRDARQRTNAGGRTAPEGHGRLALPRIHSDCGVMRADVFYFVCIAAIFFGAARL